MAIKPWKSSEPIGYIERDVPKFSLPSYEGERYERMVPDTLDVAERADYAIHFLTNVVDPDADYEIYFSVALNCNPAVMWHDMNGANIQPKFMEALPLLRSITGTNPTSRRRGLGQIAVAFPRPRRIGLRAGTGPALGALRIRTRVGCWRRWRRSGRLSVREWNPDRSDEPLLPSDRRPDVEA